MPGPSASEPNPDVCVSASQPGNEESRGEVKVEGGEGRRRRGEVKRGEEERGGEDRPKNLLVFINPFGGRQQGREVYRTQIAPLFELAGVRAHVLETERANHARDYILKKDLTGFDGLAPWGVEVSFRLLQGGQPDLHVQRLSQESRRTVTKCPPRRRNCRPHPGSGLRESRVPQAPEQTHQQQGPEEDENEGMETEEGMEGSKRKTSSFLSGLCSAPPSRSKWNCDGELVTHTAIHARVHCQLIRLFARGIESSNGKRRGSRLMYYK
ncbi:Ceramide kinase [Acipenser ruthenus]|uniref:Ceramide kinase n=1 Tax=Acipenser ruthenus TaxID=7906 RepID=A0A444UIS7_ACIRT|nr:Ceramide kinase [Acipenser ruthenus]